MSALADALAKTREPEFLVEVEFQNGLVWRMARRTIIVPYAAGDPKLFDILIGNDITIMTTLDLDTLRYGLSIVQLKLSNRSRLQDAETTTMLDGGRARIYLWTDGLDWSDIVDDGLIAEGTFYKVDHDRSWYRAQIVDELMMDARQIPGTTVSAATWPDHRVAGGGGSVAGLTQQIVFGNWTIGIPLICVVQDSVTPSYKYLATLGTAKSLESDYNAGTVDVYDKDGAVVDPANYTFYPAANDGQGHVVALFDFGANDMSDSEPLSCQIQGIVDATGLYTGTADSLVEHPADIAQYLLDLYSNLPSANLDTKSFKSMKQLLPGFALRLLLNDSAEAVDIIDRILSQCVCARIHRKGKVGAFVFDPNGIVVGQISDNDLHGFPVFSKTPITKLLTALRVNYAWNPTTGKWDGELILDHTNQPTLKRSYFEYGQQSEGILELRDIGDESTARYAATRYIALYGIRHDIIEFSLPYHLALDLYEGDLCNLTLVDAPAVNGAGWVDHPAMLIEREFGPANVRTRWLNPRLIEEAISSAGGIFSGAEITDEAGDAITDEAGDAIESEG